MQGVHQQLTTLHSATLAGHEKYFRTTAYGLTGHMPDYACLIVGANMGVVGMCKEHLGVALALKVPVFFVVTKVDICPEHVLKNTVQVSNMCQLPNQVMAHHKAQSMSVLCCLVRSDVSVIVRCYAALLCCLTWSLRVCLLPCAESGIHPEEAWCT